MNYTSGYFALPLLMGLPKLSLQRILTVLAVGALLSACAGNPTGAIVIEDRSIGKSPQPVQAGPATSMTPPAQSVEPTRSAVLISPVENAVVEPAPAPVQQPQASSTSKQSFLTEPAQAAAPQAQTPVATPAPVLPVASQQVVEQLLADADKAKAESKPDVAIMKLQQAQRIAPREPKVYARLAALYLSQGQAARAEQMARKGLTTAVDRPGYGHFFWRLIAASRRYLGDTKGEAQALTKAQQLKN